MANPIVFPGGTDCIFAVGAPAIGANSQVPGGRIQFLYSGAGLPTNHPEVLLDNVFVFGADEVVEPPVTYNATRMFLIF